MLWRGFEFAGPWNGIIADLVLNPNNNNDNNNNDSNKKSANVTTSDTILYMSRCVIEVDKL